MGGHLCRNFIQLGSRAGAQALPIVWAGAARDWIYVDGGALSRPRRCVRGPAAACVGRQRYFGRWPPAIQGSPPPRHKAEPLSPPCGAAAEARREGERAVGPDRLSVWISAELATGAQHTTAGSLDCRPEQLGLQPSVSQENVQQYSRDQHIPFRG